MKNIHVLPTDKLSIICKLDNVLVLSKIGTLTNDTKSLIRQNIYITSDEEIKDVRPHKGKWQLEKEQILNKFPNYLTDLSECKLVILTTDQDLIKDGVQAIDDEFLEWFVKNPSCEEIETERLEDGQYFDYLEDNSVIEGIYENYKIIIPKEEPNYNMKKEILIEMMNQDEELGLYEETVEEYFLSSIKNMLQFNNDALAIRFMEKYYHAKKQQDETNNK
jgi:hypothetical protein